MWNNQLEHSNIPIEITSLKCFKFSFRNLLTDLCIFSFKSFFFQTFGPSSIHSFIRFLIFPFIHRSIFSPILPPIHPSLYSSSIHLFIHPFIHSSLHLFIPPSIHSSIHLFIHPFVHSSIHLFIHPLLIFSILVTLMLGCS